MLILKGRQVLNLKTWELQQTLTRFWQNQHSFHGTSSAHWSVNLGSGGNIDEIVVQTTLKMTITWNLEIGLNCLRSADEAGITCSNFVLVLLHHGDRGYGAPNFILDSSSPANRTAEKSFRDARL